MVNRYSELCCNNIEVRIKSLTITKLNILLGEYYHDSSFGLTLTDQIWNLQYLALNCGGAIEAGSDIMTTEQVTVATGGVITVSQTPQAFTSTSGTIGWYK